MIVYLRICPERRASRGVARWVLSVMKSAGPIMPFFWPLCCLVFWSRISQNVHILVCPQWVEVSVDSKRQTYQHLFCLFSTPALFEWFLSAFETVMLHFNGLTVNVKFLVFYPFLGGKIHFIFFISNFLLGVESCFFKDILNYFLTKINNLK